MRKENYAYFVTTNEAPHDNRSKILEKHRTSPKFKNLRKGIEKEIKKENYYHFALSIEEETKKKLSQTSNDIKLSIYSLHELSQKLKLRSISSSNTSKIDHISTLGRSKINFQFYFLESNYKNYSL